MDNITQQYATREGTTVLCLGHPPHALHPEELSCRICGALAAGAQLGLYQVQRFLGAGRSGRSYIATHSRSGQPVTIKLTPPEEVNNQQWNLWEAARREVRVVTALRHPAILPVFSCTTWRAEQLPTGHATQEPLPQTLGKDTYLLALCQYVPDTLSRFIAHYQQRETQLALQERGLSAGALVINLIQQAGSALSAAHVRGIAHGAIVPGNILLSGQDRLWVADFGLAKLHAPNAPYLPPELYNASNASMQPGGLNAYWQAVNPLSDQYMFAILCQQLLSQVLQPAEYEHLVPILQRATQQKPDRRYTSIDLFVHDLVTLGTHAARLPGSGERYSMSTTNGYSKHTDPHHLLQPLMPNTNTRPLTPSSSRLGGPVTPPPTMAVVQPTPYPVSATPMNLPPIEAQDWAKRGDKLFTMRDYEGALTAYHRALELKSEQAQLWLALGDTYFALERYKEALMAYEQAMYLNPNDAQAWTNRGTTLDALGRHQEALDCYERAEQLQ